MTSVLAKRLVLPAGQVAGLCAELGLTLSPGFAAEPLPCELKALGPSLAVVCAPEVSVLVSCSLGSEAALGVRGDLGSGLIRCGDSDVEASAWPAVRLGAELARAVPSLASRDRVSLHAPLHEIADHPALRAAVRGVLRATVVAPPSVLGVVVWLATDGGWLALEPAGVVAGVRWATVRPVEPHALGLAVAPFVALGLS